MKLLLAFPKVRQLLLDGRTQLPDIVGNIVSKRGARHRNKACRAEKHCRRHLKITVAPSSPMGLCKLVRSHHQPVRRRADQPRWHLTVKVCDRRKLKPEPFHTASGIKIVQVDHDVHQDRASFTARSFSALKVRRTLDTTTRQTRVVTAMIPVFWRVRPGITASQEASRSRKGPARAGVPMALEQVGSDTVVTRRSRD